MNLDRVRVTWGGTAVVGGGVSTFYIPAGSGAALNNALTTFFSNITAYFPTGIVTWTMPGAGEVIEDSTGEPVGAWSGGTAATVTSASPNGTYAAGVGGRIAWQTAVYSAGRRVRGSTFLVPLRGDLYDVNGNLNDPAVTTINSRIATLLSTCPTMGIHSRPKGGLANGGFAQISSGALPDRVSWLRSRRT